MLKKIFAALLFLASFSVLACLKVEGKLGIDGQTYKFDQKVETMLKQYSVPMGSFIFTYSLAFPSKPAAGYVFKYKIEERKSNKLVTVSAGEEEVGMERAHEIYAKGETGQPNSIINLKLSEI